MSESTATPTVPTVPTDKTKPAEAKTVPPVKAGEVLKEVQSEAKPNGKAARKGKGKGGKAAAKGEAGAGAAEPEAVKGDAPKTPEAPKPMVNWLAPPAGKVERVPIKTVTLDERLQHRKALQDDDTVSSYAEAMKDQAAEIDPATGKPKGKDRFPHLKGVRDVSDTKDKGTIWLYDGFQRIGARKKNRESDVEIELIDGTFADALLLSLKSNSENSLLPRTKDDARRSVMSLLKNPSALAAVMAQVKGQGGVHRVFARVCDCSVGTVKNALDELGYKPKGDTLVKIKARKPTKDKAEPKHDPAYSPPVAPPARDELTPEQRRKLDADAYERIAGARYEDRTGDAKKCVRRLAAISASMVVDPVHGGIVRDEFAVAGFPIPAEFDTRRKGEGKDFHPLFTMLEVWPLVTRFSEAVEKIEKRVQEAKDKAQAEADAKAAADAARAAEEAKAKQAEQAKGIPAAPAQPTGK